MNQANVPETNWRSAIAQGAAVWMALIVGFAVLPAGHPLLDGIAASTLLGAPLLPVALFMDLRQARRASNCPPTIGVYFSNLLADVADSIVNRTAFGTGRVALYVC